MCYFGEKIPSWLSIDFLPSFFISIKTTELECSLCINGMASMLPVLGHCTLLCGNLAFIYSIKHFYAIRLHAVVVLLFKKTH